MDFSLVFIVCDHADIAVLHGIVYQVLLYEQKPIKIHLFSDDRNFLNTIPKTVLLEIMQAIGGNRGNRAG
jgi:hypothetical protein